VLLLTACNAIVGVTDLPWPADGGTATDGTASEGTASDGVAPNDASGTTDASLDGAEICAQACTALEQNCGAVHVDACPSACAASQVGVACLAGVAPTDCNGLAMCAFKGYAAADCPGGGGIPHGTSRCGAALACEGNCNATGSPESCTCQCIAELDPQFAILLYLNNECAGELCAGPCSPSGSTPACNGCTQTTCGAPNTACANN
jgi:hypothetical protein